MYPHRTLALHGLSRGKSHWQSADHSVQSNSTVIKIAAEFSASVFAGRFFFVFNLRSLRNLRFHEMNRQILASILLATIAVSALGAAPSKLNFVFILVDDLGKQDMSCEGSTFHETPHIDAIARSGNRCQFG